MVEVAATSVFNKLGNGLYLESQGDIDRFIDALKAELDSVIKQDKRIVSADSVQSGGEASSRLQPSVNAGSKRIRESPYEHQ